MSLFRSRTLSRWSWPAAARAACLLAGLSGLLGPGAPSALAGNSTQLVEVRPNVRIVLHLMRHGTAAVRGVVALIPGGDGALTLGNDSEPQNQSFPIRTRELFYAAGYDVVSIGTPSDHHVLAPRYRTSDQHVGDLHAIVQAIPGFIRSSTPLPIWLIGASQGATSAAAAAAGFGSERLAGVVLLSPISTDKQGGTLDEARLANILVPVLLVQHEQDACKAAPPAGAGKLLDRFVQAPLRQLMQESGGNSNGAVCGPLHHHGFEGVEAETVRDIIDWMTHPVGTRPSLMAAR